MVFVVCDAQIDCTFPCWNTSLNQKEYSAYCYQVCWCPSGKATLEALLLSPLRVKKLSSPQGASGTYKAQVHIWKLLTSWSHLISNFYVLHLYLVLSDTGIDHQALLKQFEHLNHQNPDTFEPKDLDMLIKAVSARYKVLWGFLVLVIMVFFSPLVKQILLQIPPFCKWHAVFISREKSVVSMAHLKTVVNVHYAKEPINFGVAS